MKLDSKEQRTELLELLSNIAIQTKVGEVESMLAEANRILDPIRNAEIEKPKK